MLEHDWRQVEAASPSWQSWHDAAQDDAMDGWYQKMQKKKICNGFLLLILL